LQRDTSWGVTRKNSAAPSRVACLYCLGYSYTMLDKQKISMGRVRQAYNLNNNEVEKIIQELWPDAVFPVELWSRTHETFWRAFADANHATYKMESPVLPEINFSDKYFHTYLCSIDVMCFFRKLSLNIHVNALREGLKYILEESYEDIDAVFPEEREFLFSVLLRLEKVDVFDQYSPDSELFEEKILALPASSYHFISNIFSNTVLVDTVSAIRHLYFLNIPFKMEVKGITRSLVDRVHKLLEQEAQSTTLPASQPQKQIAASPYTGSKKDIDRIQATRQACEEVVQELHKEKRLLESNRDSWTPNLLYDNGKTNWKTFFSAVEARLGRKPHNATARAVWNTVPGNLKHNGRMREQ
jgi:hypothetical protein